MIAITYVPKSCKIPVVATTKSAPRRDLTLFLTPLEFRTEKREVIEHQRRCIWLHWMLWVFCKKGAWRPYAKPFWRFYFIGMEAKKNIESFFTNMRMIITPNIYWELMICLSKFVTFGYLYHFLCKYVYVWHDCKHLHSVLFSQDLCLPALRFSPHDRSTKTTGNKTLSLVQLHYKIQCFSTLCN